MASDPPIANDPSGSSADARRDKLKNLAIDRSATSSTSARSPGHGFPLAAAGVLAGVVIAAAGVSWRGDIAAETSSAATVRLPADQRQAATTELQPIVPSRADWVAAGYFIARRQAIVGSEVTAKIRRVLVTDGATVTAEQPIALLDSGLAQTELAVTAARAEAAARAIDALTAELAEAEKALTRISSLWGRGHATEVDLNRASARVAILSAQANEARAKQVAAAAEVRRAEVLVAQYTVTAPFEGIITGCNAQAGEIVSPISSGSGYTRTGICTVVDPTSIEIEVDVNETLVARTAPGARAIATPDAFPDLRIAAHVRTIVPSANREKSTIKLRLGFEHSDRRIVPEMAVKVTFSGSARASARHPLPSVQAGAPGND